MHTITEIKQVEIKSIDISQSNRTTTKEKLAELVASVKEHGILEPVCVRRLDGQTAKIGYELVFGHRRVLAAQKLGLATVPATVRVMSDEEVLEARIVENTQREDIHPLDEGANYAELVARFKYSADDVAAKVGKSRSHVYGRLKLNELSKTGQKAYKRGLLTDATALLVARLPAPQHDEATKRLTHYGLTGAEVSEARTLAECRQIIEREFHLELGSAPFDVTDAELLPKAGACSACPKRTGNQRELFADVKSKDVCTDRKCYEEKLDANWQRRVEAAKADGATVLPKAESEKLFQYGRLNGSEYVDLDETCYDAANGSKAYGKKWREVLKKAGDELPGPTIARDDEGKSHELISKRVAQKLLKKLGLAPKPMPSFSTSPDKAAVALAAKRDAIARRFALELVAVVEKRKPDVKLWRAIARFLFGTYGGAQVLERRQIPRRAFDKKLSIAQEATVRGLVVEALIAEALDDHNFHGKDKIPREVEALAKDLGVKLATVELAYEAELVAKEKAAEPKAAATKQPRKAK